MSKYLNIKTTGIYGNLKVSSAHSFETARRAALILTDSFNFTYNQFLYPYIDAHSLKCAAPPHLTTYFDTIIAKISDNVFDEKEFRKRIENADGGGILWCISEKPLITAFKNLKLYSPDFYGGEENSGKNASLYKFEITFSDDILNLPDHKIRDFSGKLCSFFEIASRETVKLGGKIICIKENSLIFSADKQSHLMFKNLLLKLYNEKFDNLFTFTNSFFDKTYNK